MPRLRLFPAFLFIALTGLVSLLADITYEGARSIYGAYLPLLGASAAALGFSAGFGELIGYSLRLLTGFIADRTHRYWELTMIGYGVNIVAIPALALVPENGWGWACAPLILERVGKAVRQPAKNSLISFAGSSLGSGKAFAVQEFLDQLGAFLGLLLLFGVLSLKSGNGLSAMALCFAILLILALLTMGVLIVARRKFPHPESMENSAWSNALPEKGHRFILYLVAIGLFSLGGLDFPLITMHVSRLGLFAPSHLPLLYAAAMLADAFAALLFGWLFDRLGFLTLLFSCLAAAFFSPLIFCTDSVSLFLSGIILWGVGMGAQESVLKAAVSSLTTKANRSASFGLFESVFGGCWFAGSWLMGWLYDVNQFYLVLFSVITQLASLPFYI